MLGRDLPTTGLVICNPAKKTKTNSGVPLLFYSLFYEGLVITQISEYQKMSGLGGRSGDLQLGETGLQMDEASLHDLLATQQDRTLLAQALRNDLIIPDFQTFR